MASLYQGAFTGMLMCAYTYCQCVVLHAC